MLKKTVALFMCGSFVVGGYALALLSAAQNAPGSTLSALATPPAQTREQGDLSSLAGGGSASAGAASVQPKTEVFDDVVPLDVAEARSADLRARQRAARAGKPERFVPVREGAAANQVPDNPRTEAASTDLTVQAPNDIRYFVDHDITGTEVPTSQRSTIMEPTTINVGDAILYTANWFAAKSMDGGSTFSYINPYTFFPSVNGGFCCDQVTAYAPNQDMALWGLLYVDDGNTNTIRIARAIGSAGVGANNWLYYDFTPQNVGFPNGVWFDYPKMTVAGSSLYVSANAFLTSNDTFTGNVIMRLPLAEIAAGAGFSFNYFKANLSTERLTEGAGSTIYWAEFATTTQMRIHRWTEGSGTVFWDNVNLNAFNYLNRDGVATSPDGTNWALRADSRPTGAYVANGIIGVMWAAKQGTGRPKPYTVHARFSEATRALVSQADIWHPDYAWMYPAVTPNAAGNLAGTLQVGGAASGTAAYPGTQMFITDDVTGASTTIGGLFFVSASNDGPNNNGWGDYFSVQPHKTKPRTWVAASHSLQGGGNGANAVPKYLWFGRERDNPTKAAITSPAPGSTLSGTSATFIWNSGFGATQYYLYVGNQGVGSSNILAESQGTNTSRLVTGIPADGSTIYVRLWSLLPTGWEFNDYTYTAAVTNVKAAITSPAPGSTLTGSSVTFVWNPGTGGIQYWLYVGSFGVGSSDIFSDSMGTNTSRLVTGIPMSGGTIYVRLWTLFPAGWQYNDYTYTAAVACANAAMTSPAPGFLPGLTVPFTWNAGAGNSRYWLYIGTSPGGTQIFNQDQGTSLSRTVNGIPGNGLPVYVRLWSQCSAAWGFIDYTYSTNATTARLTAPTLRSVLAGAAQTFTWSPGAGSSQYWLYVGSTRGGTDIWYQDQGTTLSRVVTGIPVDGRRIWLRLWSWASGNWYYVDYDFTAAGTARARLNSPAEGSVLAGASATIGWSAGTDASQYWVYLGTTVGDGDLLSQSMGTATSVTASGLPTDRRPVYMRLWSLLGGGWVFNDYVFRTYDGGSSRGRITSPPPESVLTGSSATFAWSAPLGPTQHWIYVGTTVGGDDLHNQSMGTTLSVAVTGLPVNGATIFVRLWSLVDGSWTFNDYTYTAAP